MKVTVGEGWTATVTDEPLAVTPRFTGDALQLAPYTTREERERFLLDTFGSQEWLWDAPDTLGFERAGRKLAGAEFRLPHESATAEESARLPVAPAARPGGLRADEERDCRLEVTSVLCRAPGDTVLTALRDLGVLDEPLDARVGIAPDVALLLQRGTVVGWSLTDPARHLSPWFTAPDPAPPAPATRRLLGACLDLVTDPLLEQVQDGEPPAVARLLEVHRALVDQREDRHRAEALLTLIGNLVEDAGT